jgi:hypothetical protein
MQRRLPVLLAAAVPALSQAPAHCLSTPKKTVRVFAAAICAGRLAEGVTMVRGL